MSRVYDSWEKLVGAVLDREELRRLALCDSFSTVSTDFSVYRNYDSASASSKQSDFSYHVARPIELIEILKATKDFRSNMLIGRWLFKAWIDEHTLTASHPESGMAVAVKICYLKNRHWLKEINDLVQLHHPGLVDLIGYCTEEDHMILVYEFMPQGNLHDRLFGEVHQSLPWGSRMKVALNAAKGLAYLHGREIPVIHREFMTYNILLDEELNGKLCNHCYGTDDPTGDMACVSTNQMIHIGDYAAPEFIMKYQLTTKSNVYTFGVILLELLTGIPTPNKKWERHDFSKKDKLLQIMDIRLDGQYSGDEAHEVAKVALKCMSIDPRSRPSMTDVVVALQHLQRP